MKALQRIPRLLMYCLFFSKLACNAYVYQAHYLYNGNLTQHIILLSDYHEKSSKSITQRIALLDAAQKHDAYLLSEDQAFLYQDISEKEIIAFLPCLQPIINDLIADPVSFDPNKNYNEDYSDLSPSTVGTSTPLFLITPMARHRGIKAVTIESRQAEIASSNGGPISAADVCKAYEKIVDDITRYDDDEIFNTFYQKSVSTYKEQTALIPLFFSYLRSSQKNLQQAYINKNFKTEVVACYKKIHMQDASTYYQEQCLTPDETKNDIYEKIMCDLYLFLVDTKIIHEIACHKEHPLIIVYAGGTHIEAVIPILKAHGYELFDSKDLGKQPIDLENYFNALAPLLPLAPINLNKENQNFWLTLLEELSLTSTLALNMSSTDSLSIKKNTCINLKSSLLDKHH